MEKIDNFQIQQLKSFLSINSYVGCPIGCVYCVLAPMGLVPEKPLGNFQPKELINLVQKNKYFIPNQSVLCFNNRTDPFLNKEITKSTLDLIQILDEKKYSNPVIVTSKLELDQSNLDVLESIKNLTIFFFITYSNMPYKIEPVKGTPQLITLRNLNTIKNRNIIRVHYWGPLISGYNTDHKTLIKTFNDVVNLANCSIVVGLKSNSLIKETFLKKHLVFPYKNTSEIKYLEKNCIDKIRKIRDESKKVYPIFQHTSCAISWIMKWSDYNAYWIDKANCAFGCPNQSICNNVKMPSKDDVNQLLKKISKDLPFEIRNNKVVLDGSISIEEIAFLRNNLRYKIEASSILKNDTIEWVDV